MSDFADLARFKAVLGITDSEDDFELERLNGIVTSEIVRFTRRDYRAVVGAVAVVDAPVGDYLPLERDWVSFTSVQAYGATLVEGVDYLTQTDARYLDGPIIGLWRLNPDGTPRYWTDGGTGTPRRAVRLEGTQGWVAVPPEVGQAAMGTLAVLWADRDTNYAGGGGNASVGLRPGWDGWLPPKVTTYLGVFVRDRVAIVVDG